MRRIFWQTYLLIALALLLQVHQVASGLLVCLHDGPPSCAGCPYQQTLDPVVPAQADWLDCQRCALEASIGSAQLPSPPARTPVRWANSIRLSSTRQPHFYRFYPESPLRPPTFALI